MNTYTPIQVANTFLDRYGDQNLLTHMKLQKLVYLLHGYWLQDHEQPILSTDPEVWQYGPVFSSLYRHLRAYKNSVISSPVPEDFDESASTVTDQEVLSAIDSVWNKYGKYSGGNLSDLTHRVGSPWREMAEKYDFTVPKGLKIPVDLVRDYYRSEIPRIQ